MILRDADGRPGREAISVVVPARDAERHLARALGSLEGQLRRPDEVVVVDDGSTDATAEVAERWADGVEVQVRVLRQDHRGVSAARNRGIRAAEGERIALLDADDRYLPRHLQRLSEGLDRHPDAVLCFGDAERRDEAGRDLADYLDGTAFEELPFRASGDGFRLLEGPVFVSLFGGSYIATPATLFRRDAALATGLFDEELTRVGDRHFFQRLSRQGPFCCTTEAVAIVRYHEANLTHPRHVVAVEKDRLRSTARLLGDADELGLDATERRAARRSLREEAWNLLYHASREGVSGYVSALSLVWSEGAHRPALDPRHALRAVAAELPGSGPPSRSEEP